MKTFEELWAELSLKAETRPEAVSTTVYSVASEATANSVKHAGASRIAVRVVRQRQYLSIFAERRWFSRS